MLNPLRALVASRPEATRDPIRFEVRRDEEAGLWYAVDAGELGIVTEAASLDALRERLKQLLPDFIEIESDCPLELEICTEPPACGFCDLPPR
ncbi:hypothetical protein ASE63_14915 [Bosea sp. Root381]|uniref:DUF1902 domain-containing protein n=1 Tax=Bosea sp. Root381 TaxID=1736524 RepID=UPI0006F3C6C2|nr:DUF1902 domain-containing protein [Bosea sp. Root381]KRE16989.1 hypothetical protein ASE63_14915 [Bosea sp. Root381]